MIRRGEDVGFIMSNDTQTMRVKRCAGIKSLRRIVDCFLVLGECGLRNHNLHVLQGVGGSLIVIAKSCILKHQGAM